MSLVFLLTGLIVLALPVLFALGIWYGIQYACDDDDPESTYTAIAVPFLDEL